MSDVISSPRNPLFRRVKLLDADPRCRRKEGHFIIVGARFVEEAMQEPSPRVAHLILGAKISRQPLGRSLQRQARQLSIPVSILSESLLNELAAGASDQGLLALARTRRADLSGVLKAAREPVLLVLDRIQDPGNVGVLVRLAEAASIDALVTVPGTADPYHTRAARASAGSILRVPVADLPSWEAWNAMVSERRLRVVASVPREGVEAQLADLSGPLALVLGNEGDGIAERWLRMAHAQVTIRLGGKVESLNVTSAAAILLYEIRRGRRKP